MEMRTTCPSINKYYLTTSKGGWNLAIEGKPTKAGANVLANCVGYANGRFAEIQETQGIKYQFICNAENFIDKARTYKLEVSNSPTLGGIMVWEGKGSLAGHVGIVERIDNVNQIFTSESAYGGTAFYNKTRTNDNGRWGMSSNYKFLGCIVNPGTDKDIIKYRAHIENIGWQDWKMEGETAGTTGESLRMEAIQISAPFDIWGAAHIENKGWVDYGKIDKETIIGTVGEGLRLECLKLKGNFKYRVHIQNSGWSTWTVADGTVTLGSVGMALRIEAIEMRSL